LSAHNLPDKGCRFKGDGNHAMFFYNDTSRQTMVRLTQQPSPTTTTAPTCTAYITENPAGDKRIYSSAYNSQSEVELCDGCGGKYAQSMLDSPQAWSASPSANGQWAQLDLESVKAVSAVVMQPRKRTEHSPTTYQRVNSYKVKVSTDGTTWSWVDDEAIFQGNPANPATQPADDFWEEGYLTDYSFDDKVDGTFSSPVNARYVQVWPETWQWWMSMRFGVKAGAAITVPPTNSPTPAPVPTPKPPTPKPTSKKPTPAPTPGPTQSPTTIFEGPVPKPGSGWTLSGGDTRLVLKPGEYPESVASLLVRIDPPTTKYWAEFGRTAHPPGVSFQAGYYDKETRSDNIAVRCCSSGAKPFDPSDYFTKGNANLWCVSRDASGTCLGRQKTWQEAYDTCQERSMRLCTKSDLLGTEVNRPQGACAGSGCSYDTSLIWTSTELNDAMDA